MKIHLILSTALSYREAVENGKPYSSYAPLTLLVLASLVPPELGAQITWTDLNRQVLPQILDADLVAISSPTCGAPFAYTLADRLRREGKTVILGGSHVTALPEEASFHGDCVVVGYGEKSWPQLLLDWKKGDLKPRYTDFSYPFSQGEVNQSSLNRRALREMGYYFSGCYETSRGCPNHCNFCVVSSLNSGCLHTKPLEQLKTEFPPSGSRILCLDPNLASSFSSAVNPWDYFRQRKYKVYGTATLPFALDRSKVAQAAKNGLKGVLMGFETLSTESLSQAQKGFNHPQDYAQAVKNLHDQGIKVLGTFVFGLEGDGPEVFEKTARFVDDMGIDVVKYGIATPLPGTDFYQQMVEQKRLISKNWEHYDTEHVVFKPARMSPDQLYKGLGDAFRHTYGGGSIFKRLMASSPSILTLSSNLLYRKIAFSYQDSHLKTVN